MTDIRILFPGGRRKALTLSYDDGVDQDIRLIEILRRNGLKGTFNINSGLHPDEPIQYPVGECIRRMTKAQVKSLYYGGDVEIAIHGLHHPFLEKLPPNLCLEEIVRDRENLEDWFSTIVRGMAYPYGTYNEDVIQMLHHSGIAYARTVESTGNFDLPQQWLRWHPTCYHKDQRLMELAKKFVEDTPSLRDPWLFYLWGHSYEFEQQDNWQVIEEFAAYAGGHEDIWYATNLEIHDYLEAWRRLVFRMNGTKVYNPSAMDLYLDVNGQMFNVPSGATVEIG